MAIACWEKYIKYSKTTGEDLKYARDKITELKKLEKVSSGKERK
jgi:hypothetical protein